MAHGAAGSDWTRQKVNRHRGMERKFMVFREMNGFNRCDSFMQAGQRRGIAPEVGEDD
jgi:hypothetical protein